MRIKFALLTSFALLFLSYIVGIEPAQAEASKKIKKEIAATVNGAPITTSYLKRTLGEINKVKSDAGDNIVPDATELLDRLINRKLIVQEGEKIGLNELTEIKMQIDVFRRQTLRELLLKKQIRNVKASEKEIELLYRDAVKQYKIKSVYVEKEEDVHLLEELIKNKAVFDNTIEQMLNEGKAKGSKEEKIVKAMELIPQIAGVLSTMKAGEVSPIVKVDKGFTVLKVMEVVYTENPKAREWAEKEALKRNQIKALERYKKTLYKKHVRINDKWLNAIDFEKSKSEFDRLLGDKRILARIEGTNSITIGDLASEIKSKYFHGIEEAISSKSINRRKYTILYDMIDKRIFLKEAIRGKIDKTEEYNYLVNDFYENIVFGMFIQKVVDPEISIKEEEMKKYYEDKKSSFTTPEMMKIRSIAFKDSKDAENAIEKLRKGMDFIWAKNNLRSESDQVAEPGFREYEGDILILAELPDHVKNALTGTVAGDYRFCADPDNRYLVLHVQEVFPPVPQPFEEVKEKIAEKVVKDQRERIIKDWFGKLREASEIRLHLTGDALDRSLIVERGKAR